MDLLAYSRPGRFFDVALGVSYLFWVPLVVLWYDALSMPGVILDVPGELGAPGAALFQSDRAAEGTPWTTCRHAGVR